MKYFLNVKNKDGDLIHCNTQFENLDMALQTVSREFILDAELPHRWVGYFTLKDGHISFLKITNLTGGDCLRDDIAEINVLSERGFLERETAFRN